MPPSHDLYSTFVIVRLDRATHAMMINNLRPGMGRPIKSDDDEGKIPAIKAASAAFGLLNHVRDQTQETCALNGIGQFALLLLAHCRDA